MIAFIKINKEVYKKNARGWGKIIDVTSSTY